MSDRPRAVAFIDESGDRGLKETSSPHFILTAVVMPEARRPEAANWLAETRRALGRGPQDELHWKNYTSHSHRLHVSRQLAEQRFARISSVVVCKHHLTRTEHLTADLMYMYAFRYLLERLTWLAREKDMDLHYTLAHIRHFKKVTLREYEAKLRTMGTQIDWRHIVPEPSDILRPKTEELLQLADASASALGAAFNPDQFGQTEQRYLREFAHRFYRGPTTSSRLTSYGMKMHPWEDATRAAYPWVTAL